MDAREFLKSKGISLTDDIGFGETVAWMEAYADHCNVKTKEVHGLPAYNIPLNENQIETIIRALNNPDVILHPEYGERALEVRNYLNNQKKMKDAIRIT